MRKNQMTLGSLIKALNRERVGLLVMTPSGKYPSKPHLFSGDTDCIAFVPSDEAITVNQFTNMCLDALNMAYEMSNGEHKRVGAEAPIYIAVIGSDLGDEIVDVIPEDGAITLILNTSN